MRKNSSGNAGEHQKTGKAIHSFMDAVAGEAEQYAAGHTSPMSALLEEIECYTFKETGYPSMLTGRVEGRFLQLFIALSGFRDVVDIGTFTGYSALAMGESVPPDGRVLTIEHNSANADIAQGFFDRSPHCSKNFGEAFRRLKLSPSVNGYNKGCRLTLKACAVPGTQTGAAFGHKEPRSLPLPPPFVPVMLTLDLDKT